MDAGGYGLVVMFAGVVAALRGDAPPPVEHHAPARVTHPHHHSSSYRYCTNFAVTGERLEAAPWIERLEAIGDSVLVVGDAHTLKVHVHTDDPEQATAAVRRRRHRCRGSTSPTCACRWPSARAGSATAPRPPRPAACSPSWPATGWRGCSARSARSRSTAARRSTPPPTTCWPASTASPPSRSSCSPNSPNVIMAAERAAELSDKTVRVVRSRSQQAGLAAAVALDPTAGRRRQRRRDGGGARPRAHRRGHRGGARRHVGPLPARRGGRLRRRGARRVGRARRDARDRARARSRATPSS